MIMWKKRILHEDFILKVLRSFFHDKTIYTNEYVNLSNQEANDYIRNQINVVDCLMISKFGTYELENVCNLISLEKGFSFRDYLLAIRGLKNINVQRSLDYLCSNAGFFPNDIALAIEWKNLVLKDLSEIDILGSYIKLESYLKEETAHCLRVNLNGYYAPFLWKNPWTVSLKGRKVLVIHPFEDSIRYQYECNRKKLFDDPNVLPEFESLQTIRAVQSIAHNNTNFTTWFDALYHMEAEIDKRDFDIALIGCGAYGMHLAAYVKRKGKIAVHLAGWLQMLFGIYGNRWIHDQPGFSQFINEYWIRPNEMEKPRNLETIENACYW